MTFEEDPFGRDTSDGEGHQKVHRPLIPHPPVHHYQEDSRWAEHGSYPYPPFMVHSGPPIHHLPSKGKRWPWVIEMTSLSGLG